MAIVFTDKDKLSKLRPRIPLDVYQTDPVLVNAVVSRIVINLFGENKINSVLDTGAGSGAWGNSIHHFFPESQIVGIEKRDIVRPSGYYNWIIGDYRNYDEASKGYHLPKYYDLIIGNPPFVLAEEFIWKSARLLSDHGKIVYLLSSDFLHSEKRGQNLFTTYKPQQVWTLMQRPNFVGPEGESLGSANLNTYDIVVWDYMSCVKCEHNWFDWKAK